MYETEAEVKEQVEDQEELGNNSDGERIHQRQRKRSSSRSLYYFSVIVIIEEVRRLGNDLSKRFEEWHIDDAKIAAPANGRF